MVFNLDTRCYLAHRPHWALSFRDRLCGMIGRRFDREGEGLDAMIFPNCSTVHSCWMSIPVDLVFLDREQTVLKLRAGYRPWRLPVGCRGAATVIELPEGVIEESRTECGHKINLYSTLSGEAIEKLSRGAILKANIIPEVKTPRGE